MTTKTVTLIIAAAVGLSAVAGTGRFLAGPSEVTPPRSASPGSRYNICLLLDLSNRIDPALAPLQAEKDRKIIAATVDLFGEAVRHKLFVNSRDVLRVAVAPQRTDYDATLLKVADRLTIDLRDIKIAEKRSAFPRLRQEFLSGVDELYAAAVKNPRFTGSDIWSFCRDDLASYRSSEPGVRNVLIVITDGYLNFAGQERRPRSGDRTSWMQVGRYRRPGGLEDLRNGDHGLISEGIRMEGWEVLLLEVSPRQAGDLPLIRAYWEKWFSETGAAVCRVERGQDSVRLTREIIGDLLARQIGPPVQTASRSR